MRAARRQLHKPAAGGNTYTAAVLADSPAVYYRLNDTTTTAVDQRSVKNGTYSGTYTQSSTNLLPTQAGASVLFSPGAKVDVADVAAIRLGRGNISIECWVKLNTLYVNTTILDTSDSANFFALNAANVATNIYLALGQGTYATHTTSFTFTTGVVYHLVLTATGTTATLYVNGSSVMSNDGYTVGTVNAANGFSISGTYSGGADLQGNVQEFAVYPTVLSAARVTAHYNAG